MPKRDPHCCYCAGKDQREYHTSEADRIARELGFLDTDYFDPSGIVRTVLRERLIQEIRDAEA